MVRLLLAIFWLNLIGGINVEAGKYNYVVVYLCFKDTSRRWRAVRHDGSTGSVYGHNAQGNGFGLNEEWRNCYVFPEGHLYLMIIRGLCGWRASRGTGWGSTT